MPTYSVSEMLRNDSAYTQKLDYSGGNQPIYVGEAMPSSGTGSAVWRIKKLTYSGTLVTDVKWAGGTNQFTKIWDSRTGYTYS